MEGALADAAPTTGGGGLILIARHRDEHCLTVLRSAGQSFGSFTYMVNARPNAAGQPGRCAIRWRTRLRRRTAGQ
jgi:hypothetical protein